ncbi:hypothetical protein TCON_2378 [Astathelohania contejeani]|uniref:Uncharacterized protein n=1 Tax=Astathelohania contejeani TaxID=164912 RepID=A0ABQ7HW92_9MICR|nr:hypothetical protein TCON_2378 [Thelohania contejeani]
MENKEEQFESICASSLKPRQVMAIENGGNMEYLKISNISKVKTGKHGAAKVIVEGQYLGSGNNGVMSFNGGIKVNVVVPKKKMYDLIDFDEHNDTILVKLSAEGAHDIIELPTQNLSAEDKESLKSAFEDSQTSGKEVSFSFTTCYGYSKVDDIKMK